MTLVGFIIIYIFQSSSGCDSAYLKDGDLKFACRVGCQADLSKKMQTVRKSNQRRFIIIVAKELPELFLSLGYSCGFPHIC